MGYSNAEVAHRFATGIGERCTGSNMFFEGNIIYSYGYHFPMAIKYKGYLLYNDSRYSVTTAKHQGIVWAACRHYDIVYCATLEGWWPGNLRSFVERNLKAWGDEVADELKAMGKARKPEKYMSRIQVVVGTAERFCDVFGVGLPESLAVYRDSSDWPSLVEYAREEAKKEAERERREVEEAERKFLDFERDWFRSDYQIVRFRKDKNRFETSLRVEIPFETGREFYEKLVDGTLKAGDKVLWYTVREVGSEIKVGCHTFKKKWLLDYGKKIFVNI